MFLILRSFKLSVLFIWIEFSWKTASLENEREKCWWLRFDCQFSKITVCRIIYFINLTNPTGFEEMICKMIKDAEEDEPIKCNFVQGNYLSFLRYMHKFRAKTVHALNENKKYLEIFPIWPLWQPVGLLQILLL